MSKKSFSGGDSSGGFTLIELAIVLTIVSLLIIPGMRLFEMWQDQSKVAVNQQRMSAIQQGLANFMNQYGRLPCPASFIAQPQDLNYGREVVPLCLEPGTKPEDNRIYTPDGKATFAVTGRSTPVQKPPLNPNIIIGAVPVRDLALPDNVSADAWGHLFTYAVTASATTNHGDAEGVIDVIDGYNHTVLPYASDRTSTGTALYVLVDHGRDGKGAYTANPGPNVTAPVIPCTSARGLDTLNCSFESNPASPFAFRSALAGKQAGPNWFDDTVVFFTQLSSAPAVSAIPGMAGVPGIPAQQANSPGGQLDPEDMKLIQQQMSNLPQLQQQMNDLGKALQQQGGQ